MSTLYEISLGYRDAAETLASLDMDEQTVADTLESIGGDLTTKSQNVAFVARNLESLAEQIKDAEAQMASRRKAIENRAAHLRRYMLDCMTLAGVKKIECPHFRISVRDNPPSVDIFDAAQIPSEYMRQPEPPPPAPDKIALRDALKRGEEIPGARLTASQRIEIK